MHVQCLCVGLCVWGGVFGVGVCARLSSLARMIVCVSAHLCVYIDVRARGCVYVYS